LLAQSSGRTPNTCSNLNRNYLLIYERGLHHTFNTRREAVKRRSSPIPCSFRLRNSSSDYQNCRIHLKMLQIIQRSKHSDIPRQRFHPTHERTPYPPTGVIAVQRVVLVHNSLSRCLLLHRTWLPHGSGDLALELLYASFWQLSISTLEQRKQLNNVSVKQTTNNQIIGFVAKSRNFSFSVKQSSSRGRIPKAALLVL
jgi:hypothetical protein